MEQAQVCETLSFPVGCFRPCPIGDSAPGCAYCLPGALGAQAYAVWTLVVLETLK